MKARFICCVCLKPGQLPAKKKNTVIEKNANTDKKNVASGKQKKTHRVPPVLLLKRPLILKTVKPRQATDRRRRMLGKERLATQQSCPVLVPCGGRCSSFLHIDCCKKVPCGGGDTSPGRSKFLCSYCKLGLRQCSICMVIHTLIHTTND